MKVRRKTWLVIGAIVLVGALVAEDLARRRLAGQYERTAQAKAALEVELEQTNVQYEQAARDLGQLRSQAESLTSELERRSRDFDEAMARVAEQSRSLRELERRLSTAQAQLDQLQGELSLALGEPTHAPALPQDAVALDRIVVAPEGSHALDGRIVSVHPEWSFVVIDLGWDHVKIGDTLSIMRDGQVQAKARVERVQENICAASILPEWDASSVEVNDAVRTL